MDKCMLKVVGQEAKDKCGKDKMCGGMKEGIKGGTHMMRLLWQ